MAAFTRTSQLSPSWRTINQGFCSRVLRFDDACPTSVYQVSLMTPLVTAYLMLGGAIVLEVIGTFFLQASQQFTKVLPTAVMAIAYLASFYLLTHALKVMPIGIAYAIWGGLGVVLITGVSYFLFRQALDLPALIGIGLIVLGVLVINLFSKTVS